MKEGADLWKQLSEDQKNEYLKKSHRCILAYKYKKMIYLKKIRKILPKKPKGAFNQFLKEKKGQKILNGGNFLLYWRSEYAELTEEQKEKYNKKYKEELDKYNKKMEYFKKSIFDMPKKPINAFMYYYKDNVKKIRETDKNLKQSDLNKKIAEIWNKENPDVKKKYNSMAEYDKKRFKIELKQFEKLGYYIKVDINAIINNKYSDEINIHLEEKKVNKKKSNHISKSKRSKMTKTPHKVKRDGTPCKSLSKVGKFQKKKNK